jgi:hypothetical protein
MSKLLDLLSERRRRQAGDDLARFFHWGNFDKTAMCAANVGHNTMIEQKPDELFNAFTVRAAAIARAHKYPIVWLENLYIIDGPPEDWRTPHRLYRGAQADRDNVYRPTHSVGHPLAWL